MTLEPGAPWGRDAPLPPGAPVVAGDRALGALVAAGDGRVGPVGLTAGDLWRTVGGGAADRLATGAARTLPVDVLRVASPLGVHWAVAHVVLRHPGWFGSGAVLMNAQFLDDWDLGPRAHPGDGLVDVTEGRVPWADRREARRRVRTGTHLPHPALRHRRVPSWSWAGRSTPLRVDGVVVGRVRSVEVTVVSGRLEIVV